MATRWKCEKCGKTGMVEEEKSVYSTLYLLEDSHAKVSPSCSFDMWKVKVF
jgi:transposase-like protein